MDCSRQCSHNDFEFVAPSRNPGFFRIVTGREGISHWACPGSHQFVYYPTVVEKTMASRQYMVVVIIPPQSLFVGHGYLQHMGRVWNGCHSLRDH